ncbi:MAG: exosortase/archaeosortase family protein [Chlamydiales bacterium]|nr:exosortase/archaeosortase family protein [Chlamydiia bacterium]MCP5507949.1 exosortase/archaeosortase family protein [Chlamydiales bacterium]
MTFKDNLILAALIFLALFIWLRDLSWLSTSDDTIPIIVAMPLFIFLAAPWQLRTSDVPVSLPWLIIGVVVMLVGIPLNSTVLLTIGWTMLLWSWIQERTDPSMHDRICKLLILPLMGFPWVALDADRIGWWFRLSGANVTAHVFHFFGFSVEQEGTNLLINQLPISVDVACAGLNTLQSMLIAGSVANYLLLGHTSRYWWNIPVLIGIAWVANTIRVIAIIIAALAVSPDFATGAFHTWGGWSIILVMFGLCWTILSFQAPKSEEG